MHFDRIKGYPTENCLHVNDETTNGDWKNVLLGEVCRVQGGFAFKSDDYVDEADGVPLIRIGDLQSGQVSTGNNSVKVPASFLNNEALRKYLLRDGDVLIAITGATTGKLARYRRSGSSQAFLNQRVGRILPRNDDVFLDFIFLAAQTTEFQQQIFENILAAAQGNISPSKLESLRLVLPEIGEQRKIAAVLGLVQRAIEQQERLIALTTELKKALLHKLFTEGLRGEPQKQTEIGPVPASWEIKTCEELCETITVGVVVKPASYYVPKGIPAFRSFNVREDRLETNDLVFFSETDNNTKLAKSKLRSDDVLVVRTGYPGTSCVVPREYEGANCIDLVIVRPKEGVIRSGFLSRFFNAPAGKSQALGSTHGLAQQHLNVTAVKRIRVPVPSLKEQDEIDSALASVQQKIILASAKKESLTDLFRTLLHKLMTAQVRVNDLDLQELHSPED
jgi:type I restriction enzyme, S subunit